MSTPIICDRKRGDRVHVIAERTVRYAAGPGETEDSEEQLVEVMHLRTSLRPCGRRLHWPFRSRCSASDTGLQPPCSLVNIAGERHVGHLRRLWCEWEEKVEWSDYGNLGGRMEVKAERPRHRCSMSEKTRSHGRARLPLRGNDRCGRRCGMLG